MMVQIFKNLLLATVLVYSVVGLQSSALGQDGGGQLPGDGGQVPGGQVPAGQQGGDTGGPNAPVDFGDGEIDLSEPIVGIEPSDDTRNQGFVGANAATMNAEGFVGAGGELSGSALAEDATFGGGVNNSSNIPVLGGRGGGGQATQPLGFTVTRRGIRARLRPVFSAPRLSAPEIVNRFGDRLSRQPGSQPLVGQYSVTVNNRTAVLSGNIRTRQQADHLVRQLRLEPGIYKIVDRLRVVN